MAHAPEHLAETVIDGSGMSLADRLAAFRQSKTLFRFLVLRDVRLRYRRTTLGLIWVFLQPFVPMLLTSLAFSRGLAPSLQAGLPYWLFALTGLVVWNFFSSALGIASASLVQNQSLLNKVWFPRSILPFAAASAFLVDFFLTCSVVLGLAAWNGYGPAWRWLLLGPVIVWIYALTLLGALLLASLSALVRDAKHAFGFVLQVWMLATPVLYPDSVLKGFWRNFLYLNPMAGALDAFRACLLGQPPSWDLISSSLVGLVVVGGLALTLFHRLEDDLAERA